MVQISYNGEVLGEFDIDGVKDLISAGTVTDQAFYFREGMTEWKPVGELLVPIPTPKRPKGILTKTQETFLNRRAIVIPEGMTKVEAEALVSSIKETEKAEKETKRAEDARIRSLPTPKQVAFLEFHAINFPASLTRDQATELISKTVDSNHESRWNDLKYNLYPHLYEYESLAHSQAKYDEAKAGLARVKEDPSSTPEDREVAAETLENEKDSLDSAKEDRGYAVDHWVEELGDCADDEAEALLKVFKKPTKAQIKAIQERLETHYRVSLTALTVPEFFLIYSKMYPDALRKGKTCSFNADDLIFTKPESKQQPGAKKSGCLGLLLVGATITTLASWQFWKTLL